MNEARRVSDAEIAVMKQKVSNTEKLVKEIFDLLNGKDGVVTKTELNDRSNTRIWWVLGIYIPVSLSIWGTMFVLLSKLFAQGA